MLASPSLIAELPAAPTAFSLIRPGWSPPTTLWPQPWPPSAKPALEGAQLAGLAAASPGAPSQLGRQPPASEPARPPGVTLGRCPDHGSRGSPWGQQTKPSLPGQSGSISTRPAPF